MQHGMSFQKTDDESFPAILEHENEEHKRMMRSPRKHFFLKLAEESKIDDSCEHDAEGLAYGRKAMITRSFAKQENRCRTLVIFFVSCN